MQQERGLFKVRGTIGNESLDMLDTGDTAPKFTLPATGGGETTLPNGKPLVLYFYPKDDTPGCTTEAIEFSAKKADFAALGVEVYGISPDPLKKHEKFSAKHDLSISLVADEEKNTLSAYGVWVEKSMYGKTYLGVERSTFLIDSAGKITAVWRKVRVKGHVVEVLAKAQELFG